MSVVEYNVNIPPERYKNRKIFFDFYFSGEKNAKISFDSQKLAERFVAYVTHHSDWGLEATQRGRTAYIWRKSNTKGGKVSENVKSVGIS